jgi:hypothetical protein
MSAGLYLANPIFADPLRDPQQKLTCPSPGCGGPFTPGARQCRKCGYELGAIIFEVKCIVCGRQYPAGEVLTAFNENGGKLFCEMCKYPNTPLLATVHTKYKKAIQVPGVVQLTDIAEAVFTLIGAWYLANGDDDPRRNPIDTLHILQALQKGPGPNNPITVQHFSRAVALGLEHWQQVFPNVTLPGAGELPSHTSATSIIFKELPTSPGNDSYTIIRNGKIRRYNAIVQDLNAATRQLTTTLDNVMRQRIRLSISHLEDALTELADELNQTSQTVRTPLAFPPQNSLIADWQTIVEQVNKAGGEIGKNYDELRTFKSCNSGTSPGALYRRQSILEQAALYFSLRDKAGLADTDIPSNVAQAIREEAWWKITANALSSKHAVVGNRDEIMLQIFDFSAWLYRLNAIPERFEDERTLALMEQAILYKITHMIDNFIGKPWIDADEQTKVEWVINLAKDFRNYDRYFDIEEALANPLAFFRKKCHR